ncbi:MAG: hypothetical protein ACI4RC_04245 [Oscillospiraceae bacterium]
MVTIMNEQLNKIMMEHLELLADAAENCSDGDLESITNAMISTASFLNSNNSDE